MNRQAAGQVASHRQSHGLTTSIKPPETDFTHDSDCGQRHLADLCLLRNVRVEGWSRINARATLTTYNYVSLGHPFTLGCVYAGNPGSLLVP